jgi:hypothetical protein
MVRIWEGGCGCVILVRLCDGQLGKEVHGRG